MIGELPGLRCVVLLVLRNLQAAKAPEQHEVLLHTAALGAQLPATVSKGL